LTSQQAYDTAKRCSPIDTAALIMTADHVAGRLRELAKIQDAADPQLASQLDALAAQLVAGSARTGRPEYVAVTTVLDHYATSLNGAVARKGGAR
jgi:hypothetical protein